MAASVCKKRLIYIKYLRSSDHSWICWKVSIFKRSSPGMFSWEYIFRMKIINVLRVNYIIWKSNQSLLNVTRFCFSKLILIKATTELQTSVTKFLSLFPGSDTDNSKILLIKLFTSKQLLIFLKHAHGMFLFCFGSMLHKSDKSIYEKATGNFFKHADGALLFCFESMLSEE